MKTLLLLFLCAGIAQAQIEEPGMKSDEITFSDSTGFFTIKFVYNESWCSFPLTNPLGCAHYEAEVTVNQIIDGKPVLLGKSFSWTYTKQKCYEDKPAMLVRYAKILNDPYYRNRFETEPGYPDDLWGYINEGTPLLPKMDSMTTIWRKTDTTGLKFLTDTTPTTSWRTFYDSTSIGRLTMASFGTWSDPDTIKVIMMVSDTSKHDSGKRRLVWIWGSDSMVAEVDTVDVGDDIRRFGTKPDKYDIVSKVSDRVFWIPGYIISRWNKPDVYLDSKKKPIPYVVWESRRIER